jgi:hypothetical protein
MSNEIIQSVGYDNYDDIPFKNMKSSQLINYSKDNNM